MKILILDGTFGTKHDALLAEIASQFKEHNTEVFKIEEHKIAYCTGCWSCWVKTPGLCAHMDDTQMMLSKSINSDMVIMFTENSVGFMTSNSKKALEKFVPFVHPYIELVDGECHHIKRYDKYPKLGFIFVDDDLVEKDFEVTKHIVERAALNFKTTLDMALHITSDKEALNYENIRI